MDTADTHAPHINIRDSRVDVLKGWGIFLVVAGHYALPYAEWIYTFHMPLFFFLSGYLRVVTNKRTFAETVRRRCHTCLIPYTGFWLLNMLVIRNALQLWHSDHLLLPSIDELKGLLLGGHWLADNSNCFPLWYLQHLFIASIIFECIVRLTDKRIALWGILAFLMIITIPFQTFLPGRPIFHINVLPAGLSFMLLGYLLRQPLLDLDEQLSSLSVCIALIALGFTFSMRKGGNISDIASVLYYPGALCTIVGFWGIAGTLSHSRALEYAGSESLWILGLHKSLYELVSPITDYTLAAFPPNALASSLFSSLLAIPICCAFALPLRLLGYHVRSLCNAFRRSTFSNE